MFFYDKFDTLPFKKQNNNLSVHHYITQQTRGKSNPHRLMLSTGYVDYLNKWERVKLFNNAW